MKWFFSVYWQCVKNSVATGVAYRANFLLTVFVTFVSQMLLPMVTMLIYHNGASFPGYTFYEALLIQAVFLLCTGLAAPLFYGLVWNTMDHVREGSFDILLLRPGSVFLVLLAKSFSFESLGGLLGGLTMFCYALSHLEDPGFLGWVAFFALFVSGLAVSLGLVLVMASTAFKWIGMSRIFEIYDAITAFGRYPAALFHRVLFQTITFVVPVAMLGFIPAAAILNKLDATMFAAMVPCFVFMFFGVFLYQKMVRSYQSGGG